MRATAAARSILRSAVTRTAASATTLSSGAPKPVFFLFRSSKQSPLSRRLFRLPVELSCCVETMLPYHTATASSLLNSKLSVSRFGYGWTLDGG